MKGKIEILNERLKNKELSVKELTEYYLSRAEKEDGKINSFITLCRAEAMSGAEASEKLFAEGKDSILTGIPMNLKDNISAKGIRTTAGSKLLYSFVPVFDAYAYSCLKREGAVLLGKTNMDEFGMGASSDTSFFGEVFNPLDVKRCIGGSSGGSAASVTAGFSVYSLGTDTGGSLRLPASYSGTVALCPTYGAVSRRGLIAYSSTFDRVGVLSGRVSDVAHVFEAMNTRDEKDMTSSCKERKSVLENIEKGIKGLKIGVVTSLLEKAHEETKKCFSKVVKAFEALGAEVLEIDIPSIEKANAIYSVIALSDAASNLLRYDGVRYGKSEGGLCATREGFGDEVRMRMLLGNAILTSENEHSLRSRAEYERLCLEREFEEAFRVVSVIISPSAYHTAPVKGEIRDNLTDDFLTAPSVSHLPSLSMPMGFSENGLPLGLQIIGGKFSEDTVLRFAYAFEEAFADSIYKKGGEDFEL